VGRLMAREEREGGTALPHLEHCSGSFRDLARLLFEAGTSVLFFDRRLHP
ncbi:uncharacterized protein METZ01_LOCUS292598, partial [marine metagenome]